VLAELARRAQSFRLFAMSDVAATGIRGAGDVLSFVSNVGPCDLQFAFGLCHAVRGTARRGDDAVAHVFGLQLIAGVPATEWQRATQRVPSLAQATGGGWSVEQNFSLFAGRLEIGPADGSLGRYFSGAVTTNDGSCLDNTGPENGFVDFGIISLAASDCAPTWAGRVFDAEHPIPESAWLMLSAQQGTAFRFERHRVPADLRDRRRMLGDFQTYGLISDHYREILADYGAVVPGSSAAPRYLGWPLGLEFFFRVYTLSDTRVASTYIWEMYVVNRSQDVYGVGLDYDSLYVGIEHGMVGVQGDRHSLYWDAGRSALIWHQVGVNEAICSETARIPLGGAGCPGSVGRGYRAGGSALLWLKSPYGDLRNRLFSRPESQLFDPSHPAVADTILFNHGHMCGFGGCWANTHNVNDRRAFGMLSSTEANVLDGRDPAALTSADAWRTFRNREYPAVRGVFNKWVPGGFDHNRDGIQDTLYFDSCGGRLAADMALGCVALDGDTLPGGQLSAYANVGGITATGPFPLAAGDTVAFTWAFIGARDKLVLFGTIEAITDLYLDFYRRPGLRPHLESPRRRSHRAARTAG
jgi:hypothetical protein